MLDINWTGKAAKDEPGIKNAGFRKHLIEDGRTPVRQLPLRSMARARQWQAQI